MRFQFQDGQWERIQEMKAFNASNSRFESWAPPRLLSQPQLVTECVRLARLLQVRAEKIRHQATTIHTMSIKIGQLERAVQAQARAIADAQRWMDNNQELSDKLTNELTHKENVLEVHRRRFSDLDLGIDLNLSYDLGER